MISDQGFAPAILQRVWRCDIFRSLLWTVKYLQRVWRCHLDPTGTMVQKWSAMSEIWNQEISISPRNDWSFRKHVSDFTTILYCNNISFRIYWSRGLLTVCAKHKCRTFWHPHDCIPLAPHISTALTFWYIIMCARLSPPPVLALRLSLHRHSYLCIPTHFCMSERDAPAMSSGTDGWPQEAFPWRFLWRHLFVHQLQAVQRYL